MVPILTMPASRRTNTAHRGSDNLNDGETIDITNISDTSTSSQPSLAPTIQVNVPAVTQVDATAAAIGTPALAPLLPSAPTTRTNRAHDIDYFFTRGLKTEGTLTICKPCR